MSLLSSPAHARRRLGRPFVRLWYGFTLACSGDGMAYGAVPLLAVAVNPHPIAVSAVAAADSLPWLLVALPAGAFADRFERGPLMALSNILRAGMILVAAFLVLSGQMTLWLLIVAVLVNASARAIYYSSYQAIIPAIVDTKELEHANGVLSATEAGVEHLAGPVVGTSLFAVSSALPFFADTVALVLSCLPFARFRSKADHTAGSSSSIWEGARLLFADHRLRWLVLMVASLAGLQGLETGVLVLLATTEWGVHTAAYGLFLAAGAAGGLVGSVVADRLVKRFGSAQTLIGAALVSGLAYLIMAVAKSWVLAAPAYVLVGLAVGTGSVVAISLRQRLTPDDLMGRVGGAWRGIVWGAAPVGALAAGAIAALGGLRLPILLAGVLQCLVAVLLARSALPQHPRRQYPMSAIAIAHRGDPVRERENTLPAFASAVALGADMVELDLRRTGDGQIVVLHDQTLERLWGVDVSVGDLDWTEVAAFGEGQRRISLLDEVLRCVSLPLMVDFTRREVVPGALAAVQGAGALDRSLFVTGNVAALRMLRELSDEARIGLTWTEGTEPPLTLLAELGAEYWNPMFAFVTAEGVAAVHDAGRTVSTWTVDTPSDMARMLDAGVDAVVSNQVAALVAFLRNAGSTGRLVV